MKCLRAITCGGAHANAPIASPLTTESSPQELAAASDSTLINVTGPTPSLASAINSPIVPSDATLGNALGTLEFSAHAYEADEGELLYMWERALFSDSAELDGQTVPNHQVDENRVFPTPQTWWTNLLNP